MSINEWLYRQAQELGLSMVDLAELAGLDKDDVKAVIMGRRSPTLDEAAAMTRWLLLRKNGPQTPNRQPVDQWLYTEIIHRGWSNIEFARIAGVNIPIVKATLKGEHRPSVQEMALYCEAFLAHPRLPGAMG